MHEQSLELNSSDVGEAELSCRGTERGGGWDSDSPPECQLHTELGWDSDCPPESQLHTELPDAGEKNLLRDKKNLPGLYLKLGPLSKNRADLCLPEPVLI